jgi:diguanylate cyclase (GGDEF)-like protein
MRVLVVDSGPRSELAATTLTGHFEVLMACPAEAEELLGSDIAVAIAVTASDWDAVEFLAGCRRRHPLTRRALVVSDISGQHLQRAINNAGIHYVLRRPLNPEELLDVVRRLAGDYNDARAVRLNVDRPRRGDGALANKDRLTGLYNHRSFQERLREELARARRYAQSVSILLGDIDNFGELNRAAGYRCGDEVLQRVAAILRSETSSVRECDITSRYGGQQFAIILPETDKAGAEVKAERLRESIGNESLPDGVSVTMSFGIATFPTDTDNASTLLAFSEQSLLEAKRQGRNRVLSYRTDMEDRSPVLNVHAETFPTFHSRMGDLVHCLERDRTLACLFIDLSRLRRVEQEFGVAQHNQLFARAGEILLSMRGGKLRREDLLCRTADADGYFCFVSPPRFEGSPKANLRTLTARLTEALEEGLTEAMRGLTRDQPQVAVGTARVLNNPMVRGERLIHRVVEEARQSAGRSRVGPDLARAQRHPAGPDHFPPAAHGIPAHRQSLQRRGFCLRGALPRPRGLDTVEPDRTLLGRRCRRPYPRARQGLLPHGTAERPRLRAVPPPLLEPLAAVLLRHPLHRARGGQASGCSRSDSGEPRLRDHGTTGD